MLHPRLPLKRPDTIEFWKKLLGLAADRDTEAKRAAGPGSDVWQAKRWLARNDLFYLLAVVLGRKDANRDWLFDRCREVAANPNGHLDLWAREHFKSTILTFALTIQDIIASHGDEPEPRYGGREVTVGIFSHTRPIAKGFLKQIKAELENNKALNELFPEILWGVGATPGASWSEDGGITVRRKTNPKEATVEAWGLVDGQPTSKHFLLRVYDDVVTRESVYTPDQIQNTTKAWELSDNLGTEGGWARYIGTRYHLFDTYATMIERGIPARTHPCTSDGSTDFSKAVLMKPETLAVKRHNQGPYTFSAQMLLNPIADDAQGFKRDWLRYWPCETFDGLNLYIFVDPSSGKRQSINGGRVKDNDYSSMWVVGYGADGNRYICDIVRDRLNLTAKALTLINLHRKWSDAAPVAGVFYEEYGMQADIEHVQTVQAQQNYRFDIKAVGGSVSKADRIKRLVPLFETGRVFLPPALIKIVDGKATDLVRSFIEDEYAAFPVVKHDDMLDALARMEDPEVTLRAPIVAPKQKPSWRDELEMGYSGGSLAPSDNWMVA